MLFLSFGPIRRLKLREKEVRMVEQVGRTVLTPVVFGDEVGEGREMSSAGGTTVNIVALEVLDKPFRHPILYKPLM